MQSIVLVQPGQFELVDAPLPPAPALNEAQVKILRVGICGTDLHAFAGKQPYFTYPRVLGHELAVEVIALGDTTLNHDLRVGDKCCIRPYLNCGECAACKRGFENACMRMQVLGVHRDGGMREVINVPIDHLHKANVSDEELALVEMLSIGAHAVRRAQITPNEFVLVIGAGPIGLGVSQFAAQAGARVLMMDISDNRLAFACQQKGIEQGIDGKGDVMEQLKAIIPDDLPTVVFDATGSPKSMMNSFAYVAQGGKLVYVGLFQGDVTFSDPDFHKREMMLLASRNATRQDFGTVINALETGSVNIKSWITHHAAPEQMVKEFPSWLEPSTGVIKAMLTFA